MKTSALLVALVTLLAACGGGDDDSIGVTGTPGPATPYDPAQAGLDYLDALEVVMEQAATDWQALDEQKATAFDSATSEVDAAQAALVLAGDYAAKAAARRFRLLLYDLFKKRKVDERTFNECAGSSKKL